ncbi:hypothetical protein ZIOFF_008954 [Zingiber officinale]|uniref:Uncharacterized protein n=1 Tax=Zingiber officinale TaxID=94328 RepID=A0A8J5IH74_ZINOF|nr:hypothetical protein ZIOFF_008954 [Zingiber officinale]
MVAQSIWDTPRIDSSDEDELCHVTRHMTFMTFEDCKEASSQKEVSSEDESSNEEQSSNESSSSDDEVKESPKVELLYKTIAHLKNALVKSQSRVKTLKGELKSIRNNVFVLSDRDWLGMKCKMSSGEVRKVQNLIEQCLRLHMNQKEVVDTLSLQAKIEPSFTELEPIMGDTDPITSKLDAFMERLISQQQVFMEQITSRQQGLEEQIAEISRTVQDARRLPLHIADSPISVEYDPSRDSKVKLELPTSGTMAPRYSKMESPPILEKGIR